MPEIQIMRKNGILKTVVTGLLQPVINKKIQRTSFYKWKNIRLRIPPGVFHPKYFFSTKYLLERALQLELHNKTLLKLGAGNGLISIATAGKGALVTATDINEKAIEALKENAALNNVSLQIILSNLFENISPQQFDIIVINPPYYPKTPKNTFEAAWYCGENFEYFENLFQQLGQYIHAGTKTLMVLSQDCNLQRISALANAKKFNFTQTHTKKFYWERNFIFEIEKSDAAFIRRTQP